MTSTDGDVTVEVPPGTTTSSIAVTVSPAAPDGPTAANLGAAVERALGDEPPIPDQQLLALERTLAGFPAPRTGADAFVHPGAMGNTTRHPNGELTTPAGAHNDAILVVGAVVRMLAEHASGLFNDSDFPCGDGPNAYTVCVAPDMRMDFPEGDALILGVAFDGEIPLADPEYVYRYGFVFDTDGSPDNNYTPDSAFPADFFAGTDFWFDVQYNPAAGWFLFVTDPTTFARLSSAVRVIISSNAMILVVPISEFPATKLSYRVTSFKHMGGFGLDGDAWTGDVFPPVDEPLLVVSPASTG